ncbi:MAG: LAGLIDADG family homing endonuclease [bacterium]
MGIPREPRNKNQGLRRDYTQAPYITKAYLLGMLHDGTKHKTTYRIAQKGMAFAKMLSLGIKRLSGRAWIYQEGKLRDVYITEFSQTLLHETTIKTDQDKLDYVRGYFDAEGGIAKSSKVRFYIYFAQKNFDDLNQIKTILEEFSIHTGIIHNPSKNIDPKYWRFFVKADSYKSFITTIGSSHPDKKKYFRLYQG